MTQLIKIFHIHKFILLFILIKIFLNIFLRSSFLGGVSGWEALQMLLNGLRRVHWNVTRCLRTRLMQKLSPVLHPCRLYLLWAAAETSWGFIFDLFHFQTQSSAGSTSASVSGFSRFVCPSKTKEVQSIHELLCLNQAMQNDQDVFFWFTVENRTPPQALLLLENKSWEISVVCSPLFFIFYSGQPLASTAMWSTWRAAATTLCNHQDFSRYPSETKALERGKTSFCN